MLPAMQSILKMQDGANYQSLTRPIGGAAVSFHEATSTCYTLQQCLLARRSTHARGAVHHSEVKLLLGSHSRSGQVFAMTGGGCATVPVAWRVAGLRTSFLPGTVPKEGPGCDGTS